jgi:hypothetical protein
VVAVPSDIELEQRAQVVLTAAVPVGTAIIGR